MGQNLPGSSLTHHGERAVLWRVTATDGHSAHDQLSKWLATEQISFQELARRCSSERNKFDAKAITRVVTERKKPTPHLAGALERVTGIEVGAWEPRPPESERRAATPRELGTTKAELLETIRLIDLALAGKPSDTALANLAGKRTSALIAISRLDERASLEDHPEFPAKLEIILDALDATLRQFGVEPVGAREAFVGHVDALEKRLARAA